LSFAPEKKNQGMMMDLSVHCQSSTPEKKPRDYVKPPGSLSSSTLEEKTKRGSSLPFTTKKKM
jgi:hypothetical protein